MNGEALIEHVTQQRWYGAKSRTVTHAEVLDSIVVRSVEPELTLDLVGITYDTGAHDIYQLFSSSDPELARELVSAMRSGHTLQGEEGVVEFHPAGEDVVLILRRGRQPIADCVVEAEATRADTDPKVFTRIHLRYAIAGRGLDAHQVERAVKLSKEKYCSATIMLAKSAEITHEISIVEGDALPAAGA